MGFSEMSSRRKGMMYVHRQKLAPGTNDSLFSRVQDAHAVARGGLDSRSDTSRPLRLLVLSIQSPIGLHVGVTMPRGLVFDAFVPHAHGRSQRKIPRCPRSNSSTLTRHIAYAKTVTLRNRRRHRDKHLNDSRARRTCRIDYCETFADGVIATATLQRDRQNMNC